MPALAGTARMSYLLFLGFNAAGGLLWGVGFTLVVWPVHAHRRERGPAPEDGS